MILSNGSKYIKLSGKLKNLGRLALNENKLSGNIPTVIGNLTMLSELYLYNNKLEGSIPSSLRYCTQLQTFSISDNNLSGDLPNQTFSYLERLVNLDLENNSLTGPLPSEFGTGSFGSVYKGSLLHFESPVAIKVLNLETCGAAKSFMVECNALGRMKHRNLLNILTCCSSVDYKGEDFKAIVFKFMSNGSLENLLHDNAQFGSENINIYLREMVNIALDVAHSLDYLHNDSEQALVHRDVKPSNVLLDDDFVAHLGDFGLARLIHGVSGNFSKDLVNSSAITGTIGYVPPECGAGDLVSLQGDIYSYGILLLEMLIRKRPTNSMFGESLSLHKFCEMAIPEGILEIVDSRLLVPYVEDHIGVVQRNVKECLVSFVRIGVACSEELPTRRMCLKDVIVKLNEIKKKLPG